MPQKSTKHKNALQPSRNIKLNPESGKATGWKAPRATKPKDASRPSKEVAQDPQSRKAVPVKPVARSATMPSKPKEQGKLSKSLKSVLDYTGGRSKGYKKECSLDGGYQYYSKNGQRATRQDRAGILTEGSAVEEAADDGGAAGSEAAAREDTDDGNSDDGDSVAGSTTDEDSGDGHTINRDSGIRYVTDGDSFDGYTDDEGTDDEDAVGAQTGGRGPTEIGADRGDGGRHSGDRVIVEEDLTEARPARRTAARRDDATTPTAGVEVPTRDSSERHRGSTALIIRDPGRARRDDARRYAADREAPTRESRERDFGSGELVRRDPGRPHPQRGAPRMVPDESILDRMPPFGTGHDFGADGEVDRRLARDLLRREREQLQRNQIALARQRPREDDRGGQGYQGQGYQGQAHGGQAHGGQAYGVQAYGVHGDMGQGRGGQNATRTIVVQSTRTMVARSTRTMVVPVRDDPGDD